MNFRDWFRKYFTRDLTIPRIFTGFFLAVAFNFVVSIGVVLNNTWFIQNADTITKSFIITITIISLTITTLISDKNMKKTLSIKILVILDIIGFGFFCINFTPIYFIGLGLIVGTTIPGLVLLISTLIHETNILNRGRVTAYLLMIISLMGLFALFMSVSPEKQVWILIPMVLCVIYVIFKNTYCYIESKERISSKIQITDILKSYSNWGKFISFFTIAFTLGIAYLRFKTSLDVEIVYYVLLGMILIAGVLIDNFGRKPVLISTTLLLSIVVLFATDVDYGFWTKELVSSLYGIVIVIIVVLFITYSGDSTRDEFRKYRSIIVGGYMIGLLTGFALGNTLGAFLMELYELDPILYAGMPDMINKIGGLVIIIELIALYPLKDTLESKEIDWFISLRHLYIFNENGICLYSYDFTPEVASMVKMKQSSNSTGVSQDLVSGGLSGIVSLISEITESKKHLRVVDHEDKKLIFHYGKYAIFCLISTQYLNILVSKLKEFAMDFESTFSAALKNFKGGVSVFDDTGYIVTKHFKQTFFDDDLFSLNDFEFE